MRTRQPQRRPVPAAAPVAPPHPRTLARRQVMHAMVATEAGQIRSLSLPELPEESRGFGRELLSGTLRWQGRLDWTLKPLLSKPIEKLDAPVRAVLRLALYEWLVLETPLPALCNDYAGMMRGEKLSSATGFVNAVLRKLPLVWRPAPHIGDPVAHLTVALSHPRWLVARWMDRLGQEGCQQLLEANNQVPHLCLRVNTLRGQRESILTAMLSRGLKVEAGTLAPETILVQGGGDPTSWPEWERGEVLAQDAAAQLVARLAAPEAGALVVDAASAPGGKTTHLAQIMGDKGRILACDSAVGRLKLVRENAERLGMACIETCEGDFAHLAPRLLQRWQDEAERADREVGLADVVLLDAPCSGTGTLRRRPDAKWRKTPGQLAELVQLQAALLDAAATLVAPGGSLVYSTCSLEAEENEGQVQSWLLRNPEFGVAAAGPEFEAVRTQDGFLQTWPHLHGCDGMFAAKLVRKA